MNDLQIFDSAEFGQIRAVELEGEPWLVGKDVARALGYSNTRDAIVKHVDEEDKGVTKCDTLGGEQEMTIINESGLYSLIFSSKLPDAKKFKRWVTSEVLPAIRKTGSYLTPEAADQLTAAVQERIQAAWAGTFQALTERVATLEALIDPFAAPPALPAPPPADPPRQPPGRAAKKRWMRTASEKLDLLSNKFGLNHGGVLHQMYQYLERRFGVVLEEERLRVMEEEGLDTCSTLTAIFYVPEFREYLESCIDYNLAPENRGW